jgi:hypothetical protein
VATAWLRNGREAKPLAAQQQRFERRAALALPSEARRLLLLCGVAAACLRRGCGTEEGEAELLLLWRLHL